MAVDSQPSHTEVQAELEGDASNSLRDMLNTVFGSEIGSLMDFAGYSHDTTPPSDPFNLEGTGSTDGSGNFSLNWSHSQLSDFSNYEIFRNGSLYTTTTSKSYNGFQGAEDSNDYKVRAVDDSDNKSGFSNEVIVTTSDLSCLVKGTMITLYDGFRVPIETLVKGDELLGADIKGFQDTNSVENLYQWEGQNIQKNNVSTKILSINPVKVPTTIIINNGEFQASNPHSQLVKRNGLWKFISLNKVQVGDTLYTQEGDIIEVYNIDKIKQETTVYKMTLEHPVHTFYANGILTHNVK